MFTWGIVALCVSVVAIAGGVAVDQTGVLR